MTSDDKVREDDDDKEAMSQNLRIRESNDLIDDRKIKRIFKDVMKSQYVDLTFNFKWRIEWLTRLLKWNH